MASANVQDAYRHDERSHSESRRGAQQEGGLQVGRDREPEGADHDQGQQQKEDPHPPHAGDRDNPSIGRRQLRGRGGQGNGCHPPQPFVKSNILPAPASRKWKISRTRAGVATRKTITAWITDVRSIGMEVVACM